MTTDFSQLGLHPELVQAVTALGYETPTAIQAGVIPLLLAGKDVIGQAQTGTGKTAAFALPILHNLQPDVRHVQALIIAPTRELALQVSKAFGEFSKFRKVNVLAVYGGQPYGPQIGALRRGVDVVVGTPGRMLDLIKKKYLDLSHVHSVALDEADEMLSMGFIEDIEAILGATPVKRQTLLFSATMPKPIRNLANKYMSDIESVTIDRKALTVDKIDQRHYLVNDRDRLAATMRLLEVEAATRVIIFARTRARTSEVANALTRSGYPAEPLNGDLSQDARERVMGRFRNDQIKVLVATDVAARGLDIDDISHVINYDLPLDAESYVHRIGRTGRAGRDGVAISLMSPNERGRLGRIERYAKIKVARATLPTEDEVQEKRDEKLVTDMLVWLNRGRCKRERVMVDQLVEAGHDPLEVAAAALKLSRADDKRRPAPRISPVEERRGRGNDRYGGRGGRGSGRYERGGNRGGGKGRFERGGGHRREEKSGGGRVNRNSHEKGMVRLQLGVGKKQGVRPAEIVGTIAHFADIPGSSIGAIRIQEQRTYVDVPQPLVDKVLASNGNYKLRDKSLTIEKAE